MEDPVADPRNPNNGTSLNLPGPISVLMMPRAEDLPVLADEKLQGRVVDLELTTPTATAEHLKWGGKRAIKVYLPSGYDTQLNQQYPAVYVLLGEEMIKDAKFLALIDREIGKSLPPFIAVFVTSTSAYELARTFREPHVKMIATQLVPWIDQQFRTSSDTSKRIILGVDEAGFASLEIGLRHPQIFGGIISHSIFALTGGDQELLKLIDQSGKSNQRFYLDWGTYDARRQADGLDVSGFTKAVRDRLKSNGQNVYSHESHDGSPVSLIGPRTISALQTLLRDQSSSK
jgi:enterochelin esterase-like enzyme